MKKDLFEYYDYEDVGFSEFHNHMGNMINAVEYLQDIQYKIEEYAILGEPGLGDSEAREYTQININKLSQAMDKVLLDFEDKLGIPI